MRDKTATKLLEKVRKDYDQISEEFDVSRKYNWKEFETFLKYFKDGDKVVDLGCGNGRFYGYLKDVETRDHTSLQYIGIDNSRKLIEKAKDNFPDAEFKVGDLLNIPLENESQDVVVSIAALHHIPSKELREKAVSEMARILKANGYLLITNWNLFQPKYKKYIRKSRCKWITSFGKYDMRDTFIPWGKSGVERYYYAFREDELKNLLSKYFKIIEYRKGNNFVVVCKKK